VSASAGAIGILSPRRSVSFPSGDPFWRLTEISPCPTRSPRCSSESLPNGVHWMDWCAISGRVVARQNIRVNCVPPGNILFPGGSWERHLTKNREAVLNSIQAEVPMNRFGTSDEIAGLVAFPCSSRASFITGCCFVADGGQSRSI